MQIIKDNWKIILVILAVFSTLVFYQAAKNFSELGSYVEVKGLSEKIVKSDTAIWSMNFQTKSNNVDSLHTEVEKNIAEVTKFLVEAGFEEKEISVSPINIYEDTYERAVYRYNLNVDISVYTDKVDLVRKASENTRVLIKKGIIMNGNYINFIFSDLNSIKPEMIAEAAKNAQKSAGEFAEAADTKVGKLVKANQGVFSISQKDPGSPEWKKVRVVSTFKYLLK